MRLKEYYQLCQGIVWCGRPCMMTPGATWTGVKSRDWKAPNGLNFHIVKYFDNREMEVTEAVTRPPVTVTSVTDTVTAVTAAEDRKRRNREKVPAWRKRKSLD